jgi:hypothetical protein
MDRVADGLVRKIGWLVTLRKLPVAKGVVPPSLALLRYEFVAKFHALIVATVVNVITPASR